VKKFSKLNIFISLAVFTAALSLFVYFYFQRKHKLEIIPISKVRTIYNPAVKLSEPFGIAAKNGEVFVSDGETGKIWRISNLHDFSVLSDKFSTPSAIALDLNGDLIVADSGSHTIKRVKISNGETETIAGAENSAGFQDGDSKAALFNAPIGVAVGTDGKIFVADTYNDKIRIIENGRVSTLAGSVQGFEDAAGIQAKFDTPCGIAVLKNGNLIVADSKNRRLRLVENDGRVSTFAGSGEQNSVDNFPLSASFVEPLAVSVNASGVIYVADGNSIRAWNRRYFPLVETISENKRGFADGGLHSSRFNRPSGLAFDEVGNLFVADAENQAVRILTGTEIGSNLTKEDIKSFRPNAEEFRNLSPPRWTFDPPEAARDVAGTLGEIRGEISDNGKPSWFHNGFDIAGNYGETARFIRTEKVLRPNSIENFATLRELIRLPMLGYIHIRLGRDKDNKFFSDRRFQFSFDDNRKLKGVRIPRGTKFEAGEPIGTLNPMNHVHLIAGASGAEMNALEALSFPNISDSIAPTIEKVSLFDQNWREIETENYNQRIKLVEKTRIIVRAFDRMNGNGGNRKLGVYRLGFQILRTDKSPLSEINWTISFDRAPDADAVKLVYAPGSQSGYTPQTVFNYIITNIVNGDEAREDFFDAAKLENGNYILRVYAADFFQNNTARDIDIEIVK
jgi:sugar lactone lactonase YvrE